LSAACHRKLFKGVTTTINDQNATTYDNTLASSSIGRYVEAGLRAIPGGHHDFAGAVFPEDGRGKRCAHPSHDSLIHPLFIHHG
jgi:hypothetical protein